MSDPSDETNQSGFDSFNNASTDQTNTENPSENRLDGSENSNEESMEPPSIKSESFNEYWFKKNAERNIEENHPERNDPSHSWPIGRFEPHQLGNCQRKWLYQWLNAPKEEPDPHGIFAIGHFIEEDIVEPWLHDVIEPEYEIDNAIHVSVDIDEVPINDDAPELDPDVETGVEVDIPSDIGYNQPDNAKPLIDAESAWLTIAGSTDPAIRDPETGDVLALTEVKSTSSFSYIDEPKRMHMMQIHAYMKALGITDGYVIYVDKQNLLNPKVYEITFDEEIWQTVVDWVESTMGYVTSETLPPAEPPEDWMCKYCEYSNRCGEGRSNLAKDMGPEGFVPGYNDYPKQMVRDHLEAYPEVSLTPSLALAHPELTDTYEVADWICPNCTASFDHTEDHFDDFKNKNYATPLCPACEGVLDKEVYLEIDVGDE